MTKLEKAYIKKMCDLSYSMMKHMESLEDEKRRDQWFHEWLAIDSLLTGLEDKEHMKYMIEH